MSNELDEMLNAAPSLTLDPIPDPTDAIAAMTLTPTAKEEPAPVVQEINLTPQEQKMVDDFASQIDITNTQQVMQYGSGSQKKIADFSESALGNVRTKDMGEIGKMLTDVVAELRSFESEEDKGFFTEKDGWDHVVRDMHKLHELLTEEYPELPCFLFGHSMGSFLARTYIIRYPDELTGAIICGTGQQSPALVGAGKAMAGMICGLRGVKHKSDMLNKTAFGKYNEGFETVRTPCDWLSRDKANVDKYIADPLCGFVPTAGLFRDMMGGISFIGKPENIEKMRKDLPVFFIAGDKDPVGENGKGVQKAYDLFKGAGMKDVTLKLYPDCRHELLNELNKDEVMADILGWLNEKMPE